MSREYDEKPKIEPRLFDRQVEQAKRQRILKELAEMGVKGYDGVSRRHPGMTRLNIRHR